MKNSLVTLYSILVITLTISISPLNAQVSLDENPMVMLMKANVLFDQGRYDESVRMYNRILSQDENYAPAIMMRAKAKFELGAFKGVKMDFEKYVALQGVNKTLIKLMAKTELKLENYEAAQNYVTTALELDPYDGEMYHVNGQVLLILGSKNDACESFYNALHLGYEMASVQMNNLCLGYTPPVREEVKKEEPATPSEADQDMEASNDSIINTIDSTGGILSDIIKITEKDSSQNVDDTQTTPTAEPVSIELEVVEPKLDLKATQSIKIDEDLTVIVTYGLGDRPIIEDPDILMISSESGRVVIDVCVDASGKVVTTAFNSDESTIIKSSLTSLAMRKARQFVFIESDRERQCGRFIYNIGS